MNPLLAKAAVKVLKFAAATAVNVVIYRHVVPKVEKFFQEKWAEHQDKKGWKQ